MFLPMKNTLAEAAFIPSLEISERRAGVAFTRFARKFQKEDRRRRTPSVKSGSGVIRLTTT